MISNVRKHAAIAIVVWLLSPLRVSAQEPVTPAKSTPEDRAGRQTEWMKNNLSLNSLQLQQVETLNLTYARKTEPILSGSSGKFRKFRQLKAVQQDKELELKTILDPAQYRKYQELKSRMTETLKSKKHAN